MSSDNMAVVQERRSSYQRDDESTPSSRRSTSSRRSASSQRRSSTSRRRRRSSTLPFVMSIRQAFALNIDDYEPTDLNDDDFSDSEFFDDDDVNDVAGGNSNHNDTTNRRLPSTDPCRCRNLVLFAMILTVLVAAPMLSSRHHEDDGDAATYGGGSSLDNPSANGNNRSNSPTSSPTLLADVLGTCRDPVTKLREVSALDGLPSGAVAADHPACSALGTTVLSDLGGNAADAAVTVALCLGVANPASSGMGGGGFILIHADDAPGDEPSSPRTGGTTVPAFDDQRDSTARATADSGKVTEVVDCPEVAPSAATTDMFLDQGDDAWASLYGGLSAAVPAELKGLELAHARHGRLPWATVVRPALQLAREGVPVNENLASEIAIIAGMLDDADDHVFQDYGLRKLLTHGDDWSRPLREGDVLRNDKLADTLEAVMKDGSKALYQGRLAAGLARDIQKAGGIVTQKDIENYVPTLRSPVVAHDIQGFSIAGVPPPSSGGAAIVGIVRFLAGYQTPWASFAKTLSVHRFVEACRHAFSIRMSLSDPAYNTATVQDAVRDLVQGSYMEELRRATLDNTTLPLSRYGGAKWAQLNDTDGNAEAKDAKEGDRRRQRGRERGRRRLWREFGYLEDHGTSHFSIVDKDGNAVAMTTSVNTYFGSGIVSESTGIVVNNQMDDFATPGRPNGFGLAPSEANFIMGGKRPLSSMSPTMFFRRSDTKPEGAFGELVLVTGGSGGPKIITAVTSIFLNHIILGMPLFEATIHPRVHDQLIYHGAAVTNVEETQLVTGEPIIIDNRTVNALQRRHHGVLKIDYTGTVQSVSVDLETNTLSATCDVRKGGSPDGY